MHSCEESCCFCKFGDTTKPVFAEIEWGAKFRLEKKEKQTFEHVLQEQTPREKRKRKKKSGKKPSVTCLCHVRPDSGKAGRCGQVLDRRCLSRKSYINFLSIPRQTGCIHERCKPKKENFGMKRGKASCCPPRHILLALPKTNILFDTWQRYYCYFTPERLQNIKEMLKKKDAVTTTEASAYFKILKKKKRKSKKKDKYVCVKKLKNKRQIDKFVNVIMKFFLKCPLAQVKDRHMVITNQILKKTLAPCLQRILTRSSKKEYSQMLYEFVDQISVWIEAKIDQLDFETAEEVEETISLSTSGTDTSGTDTSLLFSDDACRVAVDKYGPKDIIDEQEAETVSWESAEEEEIEEEYTPETVSTVSKHVADESAFETLGESAEDEEGEDEEHRRLGTEYGEGDLVSGFTSAIEESRGEGSEEEHAAESEAASQTAIDREGETDADEERAAAEEEAEEEEEAVEDAAAEDAAAAEAEEEEGPRPLTERTEDQAGEEVGEREGEREDEIEGEREGGPEADDEEEGQAEEPEDEEESIEGEQPPELIGMGEESEMEGESEIGEEHPSPSMESEYALKGTSEESEEEEEEEEEEVGAVPCDPFTRIIAKPTQVHEHSADMVCCYTLKVWATWLMEVAHNSQEWCKWITEVIGQIRLYAAILRGEVKNADGSCRILYKEEWDAFRDQLECDIVMFQQYNNHVKQLNDAIVSKYSGKKVGCCSACLQSKLIISTQAGHEVLKQMVDAIKMADYWRNWLNNLVEQAANIRQMVITELPPAPEPVSPRRITAPSVDSSYYELVSVTGVPTTSGYAYRDTTRPRYVPDNASHGSSISSDSYVFEQIFEEPKKKPKK